MLLNKRTESSASFLWDGTWSMKGGHFYKWVVLGTGKLSGKLGPTRSAEVSLEPFLRCQKALSLLMEFCVGAWTSIRTAVLGLSTESLWDQQFGQASIYPSSSFTFPPAEWALSFPAVGKGMGTGGWLGCLKGPGVLQDWGKTPRPPGTMICQRPFNQHPRVRVTSAAIIPEVSKFLQKVRQ